eukprot:TRINITY_DN11857_c0_g1_i1.p1 TRINITY_DN11857_c0_g1~~TRINITY_DN11857_c0_g1_i1.p1  ORF type:complete len:297 (+),score=63.07 TRINITY_DN11857_c0_g1_i1:64-954(+)
MCIRVSFSPKLSFINLENNSLGKLPTELGFMNSLKALKIDGNPLKLIKRTTIEKGTVAILEYLRTRHVEPVQPPIQSRGPTNFNAPPGSNVNANNNNGRTPLRENSKSDKDYDDDEEGGELPGASNYVYGNAYAGGGGGASSSYRQGPPPGPPQGQASRGGGYDFGAPGPSSSSSQRTSNAMGVNAASNYNNTFGYGGGARNAVDQRGLGVARGGQMEIEQRRGPPQAPPQFGGNGASGMGNASGSTDIAEIDSKIRKLEKELEENFSLNLHQINQKKKEILALKSEKSRLINTMR